mgnify:CR=1 FL=1|tara:strand:- start:51 stop:392 length:342 start_codon:yes stop_codon:yes gene_type:complete
MAAPNYHNYTEVSGSPTAQWTFIENQATEPGHYNAAETWTGGETTGTWGAFLISGSAGVNPTATITVAGGVEIEINNFADHKLFEIGVTTISGSAAADAEVYLFKRRREVERK